MSESIEEVVTIKPGYKLEYTALRAELLKRIELRQQILSITLTLAGVFLGFGLANTAIAFIYPSIAVFLSMLWAQNDLRSSQIGKHL
jgi:hypothetical protein